MRVVLYVTCLLDQLRPDVGRAVVDVLRNAGCEVGYDPRQTCCAQPAANAGHRAAARSVARAQLALLDDPHDAPLVVPSGSCATQLAHLPTLFEPDDRDRARAERVAARVVEFSVFLVRRLGLTDLGAEFDGRLAWHDGCHGLRDLHVHDEPRALLAAVRGAELVELVPEGTCCGFGGTFAVRHPELSTAMLDARLGDLPALAVDAIVSGDMGCLLQIGSRLAARGSSVRALHLAEVLAGTAR